jgi:hypothetical protein
MPKQRSTAPAEQPPPSSRGAGERAEECLDAPTETGNSWGRVLIDITTSSIAVLPARSPIPFIVTSTCLAPLIARRTPPLVVRLAGSLEDAAYISTACISCREGWVAAHGPPRRVRHAYTVCILQGGVNVAQAIWTDQPAAHTPSIRMELHRAMQMYSVHRAIAMRLCVWHIFARGRMGAPQHAGQSVRRRQPEVVVTVRRKDNAVVAASSVLLRSHHPSAR